MYTTHNTLKISDLRKHTDEVLDEIESMSEPVIVFSHSKPRVLILSFKKYKHLGRLSRVGTFDSKKARKQAFDFFINPPEEFMIKQKGIDVVKEIRRLRGYGN